MLRSEKPVFPDSVTVTDTLSPAVAETVCTDTLGVLAACTVGSEPISSIAASRQQKSLLFMFAPP